jgi:tetratricopeptide (TPR) repeat protein
MVMWIGLFAGLAGLLYEWLIFDVYTKHLEARAITGDRKQVIRVLERIVGMPSLGGKMVARMRLAHQYLVNRQYSDAAVVYRALIGMRIPAALEANIRRSLAECLEGLGETSAADSERVRASALIGDLPVDPTAAVTRGQLLERDNRWSEAVRVYEDALPHVPRMANNVRNHILARLTVATFRAGRPEETVRWARQATENGVSGVILGAVRSMAGVAYTNLGDLDQAESVLRLAYDAAMSEGRRADAANHMAEMAGIQCRRGALDEALRTADSAAELGEKYRYMALGWRHFVLKYMGRFNEAGEALEAAAAAPTPHFTADQINKHNANQALARASLYMSLREASKAYDCWQIGRLGFVGDEKMSFYCDALLAWIYAVLGESEKTRSQIAAVETARSRVEAGRTTFLDALYYVCEAAIEMQDYNCVIQAAREALTLGPNPVQLPQFKYLLGEGLKGIGDMAGARGEYEEAVACRFGTHWERRASDRLSTL